MTYHHQLHTGVVSSTANADFLKEPLIDVVQDLESLSSQGDQPVDMARRRLSNHTLVKSLCMGSLVGLLLQAITFSACLLIAKKWGRHPTEPGNFSCWSLCLLIHMDIAVCSVIWGCFIVTLTKKGSMCVRKKFDNDADAPNTESVWTERFLFLSGVGFLFGVIGGSHTAWAIVDVELGMPVPLTPLISTLFMDVFLCCLMIKCFDWGHQAPDEDDEDSIFVQTCHTQGMAAAPHMLAGRRALHQITCCQDA
jgi:hypothetical protein